MSLIEDAIDTIDSFVESFADREIYKSWNFTKKTLILDIKKFKEGKEVISENLSTMLSERLTCRCELE